MERRNRKWRLCRRTIAAAQMLGICTQSTPKSYTIRLLNRLCDRARARETGDGGSPGESAALEPTPGGRSAAGTALRSPRAARIHEALLAAILDHRLPPGARLPEDELGAIYGVEPHDRPLRAAGARA